MDLLCAVPDDLLVDEVEDETEITSKRARTHSNQRLHSRLSTLWCVKMTSPSCEVCMIVQACYNSYSTADTAGTHTASDHCDMACWERGP